MLFNNHRNNMTNQQLLDLLRSEVIPAIGCTEPIAVAVCAAKAREELSFIEVKCSIGARDDLGRPTTTAKENKENFMKYLEDK